MSPDVTAAPGSAGVSATATAQPPLDDIMLAMDVVDTLRRRERLVRQELDEAGREADLKERLRKIYMAQGIEVPDHVIDQGVTALKEDRFTYKPPRRGLATRLARLYVSRRKWGKWVLGGFALPILAWVASYFAFVAPYADLPEDFSQLHAQVIGLAKSDDARETAGRLLNAGTAALTNEDTDAARDALAALQDLRATLQQEYTVRIVNRPGENTGVWRVPDINTDARNYYIIVEAVDSAGKRLKVPIEDEETGTTRRVDTWGLRVDQDTFHAVADDKQDDGIIERDRFGHKSRGYLVPEYEMRTTGGAITEW
jgi:hypothetical protein